MIYQPTLNQGSSGDYILCVTNGKLIPKDPANTDYAQFKLDLSEGAELLDADGVAMTPKQVQDFLATLL